MIKGERKPLAEIRELIAPYNRILVLGCGTCVTICFAGGEKEVADLASALRLMERREGKEKEFLEHTVKRQCEKEFLEDIADSLKQADAVLSLACAVGVQAVAQHFPTVHVLPAINTSFLGLIEEPGVWSEVCVACGNCVLGLTGGICPITRCAKSLLNGPCGGSVGGKCEISPDVPCGWQLIYERLARLGLLETLEKIQPPKDWSSSHSRGPRRIVREDLRLQPIGEREPLVKGR
jgi:ferredoxin